MNIFNIIYKTTNLINNKIYVGKHTQYETSAFDGYFGSGIWIKRSIEKYGEENFIRETIEIQPTEELAFEREVYWIEQLSATNRDIGYNFSYGGNGGNSDFLKELWKDPKYREKHSTAMKSPEIKKKVSDGVKNSWQNPEHRKTKDIANKKTEVIKKKSDNQKRIWNDPELKELREKRLNPMHSLESKKKKLETFATPESKEKRSKSQQKYQYKIISPSNDVFIVGSLNIFCIENNLSQANMNNVVLGKTYSHKGWIGYIVGKEYLREKIEEKHQFKLSKRSFKKPAPKYRYELKDSTGIRYQTDCLSEFCRNFGFKRDSLNSIVNGKRNSWFGWTCVSKTLR